MAKNNSRIESLSTEQLNATLSFAQGLYNGINGYATPFMQNQNLIELTKISSDAPTLEKIKKALSDAISYSDELQGYSEFLEIFDTIYGKTIEYLSNMLAFDLSISCKNVKNPSDYKSEAYKQDLKRVYKFLDSFDYKAEFASVVKLLLTNGVSFNSFRDSKGNYNEDDDALEIEKLRTFSLQTLPQKECLITGYYGNKDLLFDFNMNYFNNSTVDIELFDPWFRTKLVDKVKGNESYVPSSALDNRKGRYVDYVQTSPYNGFYCFKWDTTNFNIVPPFASLMKSAINDDTIASLQVDKDIISAYLLLAGEIGMLDGSKGAEKMNQTKFSAKVLGEFMNLVTSGLKRNVKAVAMPLENIRGWQYNDQNPNMANNQYKLTAGQGVSASSLIFSTDAMSQSTLQNAILSDYNMMAKLYSQFEHFLELYINRKTKKYKFTFRFVGSNYQFERESRRNCINELATLGLTLNSSAWASAYGYRPNEFERMLEEAHYGDFTENLTMLLNKNIGMDGTDTNSKSNGQVSSTSNSIGGAPTKNDSSLSDKGEEARDRG